MRLILLGCPGAGKGTQAKMLCERYGAAHIATGDLFRAEIAAQTELGRKVEGYLKAGTLVPDAIVIDVVAKRLEESREGWLLDGFPRTLEQAQALDRWLEKTGQRVNRVLSLRMDENAIVERITARRSCPNCGEVYNLRAKPPRVEGKCDKCGTALVQRSDDQEHTVRKRLMVYEDLTRPLVAYYRSEHIFNEIDGNKPMQQVTAALTALIDEDRTAKLGVRGRAER